MLSPSAKSDGAPSYALLRFTAPNSPLDQFPQPELPKFHAPTRPQLLLLSSRAISFFSRILVFAAWRNQLTLSSPSDAKSYTASSFTFHLTREMPITIHGE